MLWYGDFLVRGSAVVRFSGHGEVDTCVAVVTWLTALATCECGVPREVFLEVVSGWVGGVTLYECLMVICVTEANKDGSTVRSSWNARNDLLIHLVVVGVFDKYNGDVFAGVNVSKSDDIAFVDVLDDVVCSSFKVA